MLKRVLSFVAALGLAIVASAPGQQQTASLTTLVNFNVANGGWPFAGLIADANGNLFGTTWLGTTWKGNVFSGTVFELEKTASGYASTPTILYSFCAQVLGRDCADGAAPLGGLLADANGNLFGTTAYGGPNDGGTVFEIEKIGSGYASTPTVLVRFNYANGSYPSGDLLADANGNLFGTTSSGGANNSGTVFEIAKTASGYASTPTILYSFCTQGVTLQCAEGAAPFAGLIADANGNVFGTAMRAGENGQGTVFEIEKTATGYASTPTVLVRFNGTNGANPYARLIADANGNLFGTTYYGGASNQGTVFEIEKTASGYASAPTVLVSFNRTNGAKPFAGLLADANGNLFGTTAHGGANDLGTVFEIEKTATGYASTPTVLYSFCALTDCADGAIPLAGLLADANGNLFGTTNGNPFDPTINGWVNMWGTVFELQGTGFVPFSNFAGKPGTPNCVGKSVSALAQQYGGINKAGAARGYSSVAALQDAIRAFCRSSE
jgi:uncharacterized repeat protein (TIGR03803 family)